MRHLEFGNYFDIEIQQIYIQLVQDGYCLFSFPPAPNLPEFWSDLFDGYRIGDLYHYEVFQKAFRYRTTVVNVVHKDLQYD